MYRGHTVAMSALALLCCMCNAEVQHTINVPATPSDTVFRCLWSGGYKCLPAPPGFPGGFTNATECATKCVAPSPVPDPIQMWLHDQVFHLPTIQVLNKSSLAVGVTLTCTGLDIGSFKTARSSQSDIRAFLYEIQADCAGPFDASLLGTKSSGTLALSILPSSYLGIDLALRGSPPTSVGIECMGSELKVDGPYFGPADNTVAKLLNAERGAIDNFIAGLLPGLVCPTLKDLAAGTLTEKIAGLSQALEARTPAPAAPIPNTTADTMELSKKPWVRVIEWVTDSVIGAPAPPAQPGINWIMTRLTKGSGHLEVPLSILKLKPIQIAVPFTDSNLSISIDAVDLDGVDSTDDLALLKAGLRSISSIDGHGHLGKLQAVVKVSVRSVNQDGSLSQNVVPIELGFNAKDLMFAYGAIMDISEKEWAKTGKVEKNIWKILDLNCLAPALNNVRIDSAVLNATLKNWVVSTGSKNGIDELLLDVLTLVSDHYWGTLVNALDATISSPLLGFVNFFIASEIQKARTSGVPCGDGIADPIAVDDNDYRAIGSLGATIAVSFAAGFVLLGIVYIVGIVLRRRRETPRAEDGSLKLDKKAWRSLASVCAPAPDLYVRSLVIQIAIPLSIFTATVFRVFSLASTIETVSVKLLVDDELLLEELLISFSFSQLVGDFFKAGAWLASIIIIVGSAVLPVVNLITMISLWWLPLCSHLRGKCIFLLVQSSKLSFVDAFFVSLLTYVFHADFPLGPALGQLVASPILGIYVGISGNALQKITSSYMLHMHRDYHPSGRDDARPIMGTQRDDTTDDEVDSQAQTVATTKGGGRHVRLSVTATKATNVVAAVLLVMVWGTWIMAAVGDLAKFKWEGIGGALQKDPRKVDLFTTVTDLHKSTPVVAGSNYIIILYLLLVVICPLVDMIMWTVIWFVPVPMHLHRMMGSIAEHSFSWHGLDVLALTLFAGWLELDQIAQFLVKDNFGSVADASENLLGLKVIEISTSWEWAAAPLLACAVFSAMAFNFTYGQETVRQHLCNEERKRLRGIRRAEGGTAGDRERAAAAAAAYDSDESVSESERSAVPVRVAAQYLCTVQ
eukprot:Hpha_TRINITY_DN15136_c2_g1::TRINITY_DN15136_c2_g1_i5::g.128985::m.128985